MKKKLNAGKVFLVGAGPGDEKLITLRGIEALRDADVVVYDYLSSPQLLKHVNDGAEIIYAGKQSSRHTLTQSEIQKLLIKKAKQGKNVVRLKGGDPFVFGRGGEEAEELFAHGVAFEIVPGITSAVACPAYAGIPVTHRDYTSSVAFITGHEKPGKHHSEIQWDKISNGIGTLVFFMGVENLAFIVENLIKNGRTPRTPVALIRWGTTPRQRTVTGTLKTIADEARAQNMKPPALIVVGGVVNLRKKLSWFEKKSLFGRKIMVTRAREQASELTQKFSECGAMVFEMPAIKIKPMGNSTAADRCIKTLSSFQWLIFTSANGVNIFMKRIFETGHDSRIFAHTKIACIGEKTAEALLPFGLKADRLPKEFISEKLAESFRRDDVRGKNILLARAKEARDVIPVELKKQGARVTILPLYETLPETLDKNKIQDIMDENMDCITFASSSTVKNFVALFKPHAKKIAKKTCVACIGPVTADTCRKLGLPVTLVAKQHTIDGLVESIEKYFAKR